MALAKMRLSREPEDLVEQELLNHCLCHRTSFLCAKLLEEDHPLQVLSTPAGWYLGVWPVGGEPYSRDSEYFPTQEEAQEALNHHAWTQRLDP